MNYNMMDLMLQTLFYLPNWLHGWDDIQKHNEEGEVSIVPNFAGA